MCERPEDIESRGLHLSVKYNKATIMDEAVSVIDPDAESYKKINQQLVRKIHARNKKIKYNFLKT